MLPIKVVNFHAPNANTKPVKTTWHFSMIIANTLIAVATRSNAIAQAPIRAVPAHEFINAVTKRIMSFNTSARVVPTITAISPITFIKAEPPKSRNLENHSPADITKSLTDSANLFITSMNFLVYGLLSGFKCWNSLPIDSKILPPI